MDDDFNNLIILILKHIQGGGSYALKTLMRKLKRKDFFRALDVLESFDAIEINTNTLHIKKFGYEILAREKVYDPLLSR